MTTRKTLDRGMNDLAKRRKTILDRTEVDAVFHDDQRKQLRALLGPAFPAMLPSLLVDVVEGREHRQRSKSLSSEPFKRTVAAFRRLLLALRSCVEALDDVSEQLDLATFCDAFADEEWMRVAVDALHRTEDLDPLGEEASSAWEVYSRGPHQWADELRMEFQDAEQVIGRSLSRLRASHWTKSRPGRKGAMERRVLAVQVAWRLAEAGVPLRKSADGIFAKTLAVVYEAAGFDVPTDMFRDVAFVFAMYELSGPKAHNPRRKKAPIV